MKTVLTIAGSDCSGGAGIQADIKTITMHYCYAMSVITALTAQNTTGVYGIEQTSDEFIANQLDCVFTDIFPDAVKIGMVYGNNSAKVIADKIHFYKAKNIVTDPVMVSTSGSRLISEQGLENLKKYLLPISTLATPNVPEAEILSGINIKNLQDMQNAAKIISDKYGCAVLCKGGHLEDCSDDLLYSDGEFYTYPSVRIDNPNTHGTGCTLSSAIASNLAKGFEIPQAVENAKEYVTKAIGVKLDLGKGRGPLMHNYILQNFK